jgi:BirA family transcriptional regulator, biotin operon repressor / biotin---[acetyl-CoA-carboxylase] ligase
MEEDRLNVDQIVRELHTRFIGQKIIHFPTLDSTMEAAHQEAQWGAPAGTVIVADEQTKGRGRLHRVWISPPGSLAFSIILRPNLDYLPYLVMLSSLAVTYSIEKITGLQPQIKWPNDVLVNEKKIAGILIHNDIHGSTLRFSIIGIGINVNMYMQAYPGILIPATSLLDELKKAISRQELMRQLLVEMDRLYSAFPKFESILEQWKNHLVTLGQVVRVNQDDKTYFGFAESVANDGSLMLRRPNGRVMKIIAGDVTLK